MEFAKKIPGEEELPHPPPSIYTHPPLKAAQQWGMSIDLNVCTGCSACVIACQAEITSLSSASYRYRMPNHALAANLIAIMPAAKPYSQDRGEWPENPEIVHQPMPCQHCRTRRAKRFAPSTRLFTARTVSTSWLTTAASAHDFARTTAPTKCVDSISSITIKRPVGKRKIVGAFSVYEEYFAPLTTKGAPDTIKMQKNPNVTVRMRGVMEKCTFCVQRIEEAKIAALRARRRFAGDANPARFFHHGLRAGVSHGSDCLWAISRIRKAVCQR